jgi:RNA polymerase sigma factor (sigma-70 family)
MKIETSEALMTDELIMEAVKNGELQKASVLFDRYHKRIFNFLMRMTMDRDVAEDLTQNVFLRMIKYRNSFREENRFMPWLYQMARNIFSDHYQEHKKRGSSFVDIDKMSEKIVDAENGGEQDEREKLLHKSLSLLSEDQRELLVLTRFQQMKYEEVALIMDTSVANIKVKVHRAIAKLREHYFELEKD